MPFGSSLQLDMEVWAGTEQDMGYQVGVYWYGFADTTSNRNPEPVEVLNVPPLPDMSAPKPAAKAAPTACPNQLLRHLSPVISPERSSANNGSRFHIGKGQPGL